jgi:predicted FMN-binding regulatory protein PaiB
LPFSLVTAGDGAIVLRGHLAKSNPRLADLGDGAQMTAQGMQCASMGM